MADRRRGDGRIRSRPKGRRPCGLNVILLDIGLPKLNGIEVARQIRVLVPGSRIIFVTQESSADLVKEALRFGAQAYVLKIRAGTDLLAALEAVLGSAICQSRLDCE
jgi:DNA-binding NarL/FixJ family response regulator